MLFPHRYTFRNKYFEDFRDEICSIIIDHGKNDDVGPVRKKRGRHDPFFARTMSLRQNGIPEDIALLNDFNHL